MGLLELSFCSRIILRISKASHNLLHLILHEILFGNDLKELNIVPTIKFLCQVLSLCEHLKNLSFETFDPQLLLLHLTRRDVLGIVS